MKKKRIVIKIGTNTMTRADGDIDAGYIETVAKEIIDIRRKGADVIIVTSGAIGSGCHELGIKTRIRDIRLRQACAAIGQNKVIQTYHDAFRKYNQLVALILITYDEFSDRKKYLNLKNSLEELLKLGVIPIMNENDAVATDEIDANFGDNDKLSALVASKMDANLLIMLSDIDALYDKDPKKSRDAKKIAVVKEITDDIERMAGKKGSFFAVGGMRTKINAARITMESGCDMVICNGREKNVVSRIVNGEQIGTLFLSKKKLSNKERWIIHAKPKGKIIVDEGAKKALISKKSLLPSGIKGIEGEFNKDDIVAIGDFAKAIVDYSSVELDKIKGKQTSEIERILCKKCGKVAAKSENIIILK